MLGERGMVMCCFFWVMGCEACFQNGVLREGCIESIGKEREGKEKAKRECNSRESNPGLIRGRDLSYHLTTIALFCLLTHPFSHIHSTSHLQPIPANKHSSSI